MSTIRDKYLLKNKSYQTPCIQKDFVLQKDFQPKLIQSHPVSFRGSIVKQSTMLNNEKKKALGTKSKQTIISKLQQQRLNPHLQTPEIQTQDFHSKTLCNSPAFQQKNHSLQLQKQNRLDTMNRGVTLELFNKSRWRSDPKCLLENQRLLNLQLKEETENLRKQLYELRNVEIEFQKINIYVRKLQTIIQQQSSTNQNISAQNKFLASTMQKTQEEIIAVVRQYQLLQRTVDELKQKILDVESQKILIEKMWKQQIQKSQDYMKKLETECLSKSKQLTQLCLKNQEISLSLQKTNLKLIESEQKLEDALRNLKSIDNSLSRLNNDQTESNQKSRKIEAQRKQLLFIEMQKALDLSFRDSASLKVQVDNLTKHQKRNKQEDKVRLQQSLNQIENLRKENQSLRKNLQMPKEIKVQSQKQSIDAYSYIPKKWFEEKMQYEYTISLLRNQIHQLKLSPLQQSQKQSPEATSKVSFHLETKPDTDNKQTQKKCVQTQTADMNKGQNQIDQRTKIIQKQFQEINSLQQEIKELQNSMNSQKPSIQHKYKDLLREQKQNYKRLQRKVKEESERVKKEKQINEDLTMQVLLLDKQLKDSQVRIRSKEYL